MKFFILVYYFVRSLVLRGPYEHFALLFEEWSFERKYKLNTSGFQNSKSKIYNHYQAASYRVLNRIFNQLKGTQSHFDFYDIGCGKGRVLYLAGLNGFKQLFGIELNSQLLMLAKGNLQSIMNEGKIKLNLSNENALNYFFEDKKAIYFLFNPFNALVLGEFLDRVFTFNKQECYFVYMNPLHKKVFIQKGIREQTRIKSFLYTEAIIYHLPERSKK